MQGNNLLSMRRFAFVVFCSPGIAARKACWIPRVDLLLRQRFSMTELALYRPHAAQEPTSNMGDAPPASRQHVCFELGIAPAAS